MTKQRHARAVRLARLMREKHGANEALRLAWCRCMTWGTMIGSIPTLYGSRVEDAIADAKMFAGRLEFWDRVYRRLQRSALVVA